MTDTAVAADFHQAFDVQLNFTAQIAFNLDLVNFLTDGVQFCLCQILDSLVFTDPGSFQNISSGCPADSVDVSERNDSSLVVGMSTPAIRAIVSS